MIIGHEHKYVFIELPHTGSTAVSRELRAMYGGEKILGKHSPYGAFVRQATQEERRYFAFSAVRNPLDVAVTKYVKYATDHRERYSDPVKVKRNRGLGNWADRRIQRTVADQDLDFTEFLTRFYRFPFNTWASLDHNDLDYVMRFENLQEDFSRVLSMLGLQQVRALPVINSSARERPNFRSYYTATAIAHAKGVFAGYMDEWGYRFPAEWGVVELTESQRAKYRVATGAMQLYWRYLKRFMWTKNWDAQ